MHTVPVERMLAHVKQLAQLPKALGATLNWLSNQAQCSLADFLIKHSAP